MVAIANTVIGLWMVSGIGALLTPGTTFLLAKDDVFPLPTNQNQKKLAALYDLCDIWS